jgi:hypothetical protein
MLAYIRQTLSYCYGNIWGGCLWPWQAGGEQQVLQQLPPSMQWAAQAWEGATARLPQQAQPCSHARTRGSATAALLIIHSNTIMAECRGRSGCS